MKTLKYEDGINLEYTPGMAWEDDTGDVESRPPKARVTLPAGSIAALEESLAIAAARVVAAGIAGMEIEFGLSSCMKFSGRIVGAGITVEWLEVRLRIERDKYGDALPIAHLIGALEHANRCSSPPNETVLRVVEFCRAVQGQHIVGAGDEHTEDREYRPTLSNRVDATTLAWWIEDAAKPFSATTVQE